LAGRRRQPGGWAARHNRTGGRSNCHALVQGGRLRGRSRATWIKPSFLWMAYRCGWAAKAGQERVLAIEISREGFEWALEHCCLTHYDPAVYPDAAAWHRRLSATCVRV
jgi:hypothetical protein